VPRVALGHRNTHRPGDGAGNGGCRQRAFVAADARVKLQEVDMVAA
jgi:hypothetical protein